MNTPAISVSNLSKRYGDVLAVNSASFEVPLGTICGFVGPNGSGKTTTIRMLLGLIKPTEGSGSIIGNSIAHPEKYLKEVGAMIEGPAFYPALSGEENLKVLATLGGLPTDRVKELIRTVGLEGRGHSKYKTYSLGMKQRLGIAAALLPNPKLLILDEPTNGLDPEGIPVPYLMSGGTDNKALSELGIVGYGFSPLKLPADLDFMALFHGVESHTSKWQRVVRPFTRARTFDISPDGFQFGDEFRNQWQEILCWTLDSNHWIDEN